MVLGQNFLKLWIQASRVYCVFIIIMYSSSVPHFIADSFSNNFQLLLKPGDFTVLKGAITRDLVLKFFIYLTSLIFLYITFSFVVY
jgi:hypothetical protein